MWIKGRFIELVDWVGRADLFSGGTISAAIGVLMASVIGSAFGYGPLAVLTAAAVVGAACAAIFYFFWRIARDRKQQSAPTGLWPGRISVLDYVKMAGEKGWQVSGPHNSQGIDLLDSLKQAGSDGTVQFWGRLNRYGNRTLISEEASVPIDRKHWEKFQFEWSLLSSYDNEETATLEFHKTNDRYVGGYVDIYLDRAAGIEWLASGALAFKGRRDRQRGR